MLAFSTFKRSWNHTRIYQKMMSPKELQQSRLNSRLLQNGTLKFYSKTVDNNITHNRLIFERSSYLLQHAGNPVDWYPWGNEAFEKAQAEKKLIFLSVGFSTCHWCHVMEYESFENQEIAEIMNEKFVNIKVDREERPDIDQLYMTFIKALTGQGGWPMNVFLTPDLKPLSGGTYFPPKDAFGRPGFKTILLHMAKEWEKNPDELLKTSSKLLSIMNDTTAFDVQLGNELSELININPNTWRMCYSKLADLFDENWGGFGGPPKFPQPVILDFLFFVSYKSTSQSEAKEALYMALKTLQKMAKGGIHDHIGQGFSRYSTDEKWHVPHFEKMLYDQAQLAVSYTTAYHITKDKQYADVVHDILKFVIRDLGLRKGGFYSALDADSLPDRQAIRVREGAFYTWTHEEIKKLLKTPLRSKQSILLYELFCWHYSVLPNGNVPPDSDPHGDLAGQNILVEFRSKKDTAEKFEISVENVEKELKIAKSILYNERECRPQPNLDKKIMTSWNGLMIHAFAKAASVFKNEAYKQKAIRTAKFIKVHAWNAKTGELARAIYLYERKVFRNITMNAIIPGFLNDYAFLIQGLLSLYEVTFDAKWLKWADQLQEQQDKLFWDDEKFGYYSSSDKDPNIILRFKNDHDAAEPSGNSISALNLLKLSLLTDKRTHRSKLESLFLTFSGRLSDQPSSLPTLVTALTLHCDSLTTVFLTGKLSDPRFKELTTVVRDQYLPGVLMAHAKETSLSELMWCLANAQSGKVAAYVCKNNKCNLPVYGADQLANLVYDIAKHK